MKRRIFGGIAIFVSGLIICGGIILTTPYSERAQAVEGDEYERCLERSGAREIWSVQRACQMWGGWGDENRGALWIANVHQKTNPKIYIDQSSGIVTVGLFGDIIGNLPTADATEIYFEGDNGSLPGYGSVADLYRESWKVTGPSLLELNIDRFKDGITPTVTSEGLEYYRPINVHRCYGDRRGTACYGEDTPVTLVIRGYQANFESHSKVQRYDDDGEVAEEKESPGNGSAQISYVTNKGSDKDVGEVSLGFSHNLHRTDGDGRQATSPDWHVGSENLTEDGRGTTYGISPGQYIQEGAMELNRFYETVALGRKVNFCQYLHHYGTVTMSNNQHDWLGVADRTGSIACADVSHPYNFKLKTDIQFDKDIVYAGEKVKANYNVYNDEEDRPRKGIAHTASPSYTKTRVISFRASDLDASKLTGTGINDSTTQDPCDYFSSKGAKFCRTQDEREHSIGTSGEYDSFQITVDDIDVANDANNKICVATAVNPAEGAGETDDNITKEWRISDASCRTIAKKPSVDFKAGNIYSTGKISTSIANKTFGDSTTAFGSWADHLAISRNEITHLASGATLANGNSISSVCNLDYSPLSIANSQCKSSNEKPGWAEPIENGEFLNRILGLYHENDQDPEEVAGMIINNSTVENKIVIFPNRQRDVTIKGDIIINKTNMTSAKDIPQVIIIGKNINIDSNVNRIDAWLVAYGDKDQDGNYQGGTINTCTGSKVGDISTNNCGESLQINGTVFAKNINFNRSAGAGTGENSKDPAEDITLTPAAYIWGYSQASGDDPAQAFTVYTHEIAPRL